MRNLSIALFLITVSLLTAGILLLGSCFSPWSGQGETGIVAINLSGGSLVKFSTSGYPPRDNPVSPGPSTGPQLADLSYKVFFNGSQLTSSSQTINASGNHVHHFTVTAGANYDIRVESYEEPTSGNYSLYATGKATNVSAQAGQTTFITIPMDEAFTVTWELNNGSSQVFEQIGKDDLIGGSPGLTRPGHTFGGWYKEITIDNRWDFAADTVTTDITLYAGWYIPPDMVTISGGTFLMGSDDGSAIPPNTSTAEPNRSANETLHSVALSGYSMGRYEVTQDEYAAVMGTNPSGFNTVINGPVETVSWYDALVFCNRLSLLEGLSPVYSISSSIKPADWGAVPTSSSSLWDAVIMVPGANGYRLPTEAEWEYACRAGTTTAFNWGTDQIMDTQANFDASTSPYNGSPTGTFRNTTTAVGTFPPNSGLYDMHGNVFEWCWDWYGNNYYTAAGAGGPDPAGPATGTYRMVRGGGWDGIGRYLRSAYRDFYYPYDSYNNIGFRVARN